MKKRILFWVLVYQFGQGRTVYFREWTGIGPRGTPNLKDAARFKTKRESTKYYVPFYEPMPIRRGDAQ